MMVPAILLGSEADRSEGSPWHIPESVDARSVDESVDPGIEERQLIQEVARLEEEKDKLKKDLRERNRALIKMRDGQEQAAVENDSLVKCYAEKLESLEKVLVIKKAEIAARDSRIRAKDSVTRRYSEALAKLAGLRVNGPDAYRRRSMWAALGGVLAGVAVSESGLGPAAVELEGKNSGTINLKDKYQKALAEKDLFVLAKDRELSKLRKKYEKELAQLADKQKSSENGYSSIWTTMAGIIGGAVVSEAGKWRRVRKVDERERAVAEIVEKQEQEVFRLTQIVKSKSVNMRCLEQLLEDLKDKLKGKDDDITKYCRLLKQNDDEITELAKKCSHMRAEMWEVEMRNKQQKDREHDFEKRFERKLDEFHSMYKKKLASEKHDYEDELDKQKNKLDEQKQILAEYFEMNVDKQEVFDLRKELPKLKNDLEDALKYKKYWEEGIDRKKELQQALAEKDAKIEQQLNEYEKKLREMRNEEGRRLKEGDQKDGEIECLRNLLTAHEKQSKLHEDLLNAYEGKLSAKEGLLNTYKEESRYQEERLTKFAAMDSLISKKKAHEAEIAALEAELAAIKANRSVLEAKKAKIEEDILSSISEGLGKALSKQEEEPISATSGGAAGSSTDPACPSSIPTDAHVSEQKPDQPGPENGGAVDLGVKEVEMSVNKADMDANSGISAKQAEMSAKDEKDADKAAKDLEASKPTEHADALSKKKEDEAQSNDAFPGIQEAAAHQEEAQKSIEAQRFGKDMKSETQEASIAQKEVRKPTEIEIQRAKDDFRKYMKQRHKFLEERSDLLKEKWPKVLEEKGKEDKAGFLIERRKFLDQYSEIRKEEDIAREEGNKLYAKFEKEWRKGGFYELRQWNELEEKWGELKKEEDKGKKEWRKGGERSEKTESKLEEEADKFDFDEYLCLDFAPEGLK